MGFLGRGSKEGGQQPGTTVIASSTEIVGDLQLADDFHLNGRMTGKISSSGNVMIGVNGFLEGEIRAKRVIISGQFNGTIDAEHLEVVSTGCVSGDINIAELVIEPGGKFDGRSHIKSEQNQQNVGEISESRPRAFQNNDSEQDDANKDSGQAA